jgi:hypothetical protein
MVSAKLRFRKLCSRSVPKMLTVEHKIKRAMLSRGAMMLQDSARPQTAAATQDLIAIFGCE